MRTLVTLLIEVVLLATMPAFGAEPDDSPFLGSWVVDVERLPMPPHARPKSVTFKFAESEGGKWIIDVAILDANGTQRHSTVTTHLDGTPVPMTDNIEADVAAIKLAAPNVLVLMLAKGGVPASTRIYAVDGSGNQMTETVTFFVDKGHPVMRTHYFSRVQPKRNASR